MAQTQGGVQYFRNILFALGSTRHFLSFTELLTKICFAPAVDFAQTREGSAKEILMSVGLRIVLAVWLSLTAGAGWAEIWTAPQAYEAVQKGEMVLLDIRTPKEWKASGVPEGAWPVNMYNANFSRALQTILTSNEGKRIGMICAVGGRTGYVEKVLKKNGFPDIVNVGEGMHGSAHGKGWLKRGLPVVSAKDALHVMPKDYVAK